MRRVTTGDVESDTNERSLLNLSDITPPVLLSKKGTCVASPEEGSSYQ
jgi:hypothetical protein